MGIAHLDDAPFHEHALGHLRSRWTMVGYGGLTYLAYGMRDPADICFYPRSNKIAIRGLGLVARLERLDYWDGED
ncbi:MAG: hypothetical protein WCD11_10560 [Solirubrobacteraceae bacterium]